MLDHRAAEEFTQANLWASRMIGVVVGIGIGSWVVFAKGTSLDQIQMRTSPIHMNGGRVWL